MLKKLISFCSTLALVTSAFAASAPNPVTNVPASTPGSFSAVTVGVSSAQALAAVYARHYLHIWNDSTTATIACNLGGAAVINGAGSITIPPGMDNSWDGAAFVPPDQVNCIASSASTPVTIEAY